MRKRERERDREREVKDKKLIEMRGNQENERYSKHEIFWR